MATKLQAKNAIDNVVVLVKADIDKLPSGVNIKDGNINFAPNHWMFLLDAGTLAAATALRDGIQNQLTLDGRTYVTENYLGRRNTDDRREIIIQTALCTYRIINF